MRSPEVPAATTATPVRPATAADFAAIVALNAASVAATSAMDLARLRELDALAACRLVVAVDGTVAGFALAMASGSAYDNANFAWFSARVPSFLYVDRIVVAKAFRRRGLAHRLYGAVFDAARQRGLARVVCEINLVPRNEASLRFHADLGFHEIGGRWVVPGEKCVSMQWAVL